jgi:hypothetical protein
MHIIVLKGKYFIILRRRFYTTLLIFCSHENGLEDESVRLTLKDELDSVENPIHPTEVRQ